MRSFHPPLLRKDTEEIVRESIAHLNHLRRRQDAINLAIAESRAGLADTRAILQRIDAALARFNTRP